MIEIVASDGEHKVAAEMEGICYSFYFCSRSSKNGTERKTGVPSFVYIFESWDVYSNLAIVF